MKIAISSTGNNIEANIEPVFGRCRYFLIFDSETKELKAIENTGKESSHGAGIGAANLIINEEIKILYTGNVGPKAKELLDNSNIEVIIKGAMPVKIILEKYN